MEDDLLTEQLRRNLADSVLICPVPWYLVLYSITFLGNSLAIDLRTYLQGQSMSVGWRYLFPLAFAIVPWFALRGWAGKVVTSIAGE